MSVVGVDGVWMWVGYVCRTLIPPPQSQGQGESGSLKVAMNSVVVHSCFVDSIDELFIETCDLSFMG